VGPGCALTGIHVVYPHRTLEELQCPPPCFPQPLTARPYRPWTSCLALDIRKLAGKCRLIPNTRLLWVWKDPAGYVQGTVGIFVWLDSIELVYCLPARPGEIVREHVALISSTSHGGGQRRWFFCSGCGRRVAIVYLTEADFRCRRCSRLGYASQYPSYGRSYGRSHRAVSFTNERSTPSSLACEQ